MNNYIFNLGYPDNILLRFFKLWWSKIKMDVMILFGKEISFEEGFLFRGKEHAEKVADWIKKTVQETENELSN